MSVCVTAQLKTQNFILHFSHRKVLLNAYVTQIHWPHWPHWLSSLS